jgi:glycosyltransferase A (GT-A) superfamily protein (DUF2064 family)
MMGNKYHNMPTKTADGIVHDSRKEARRWCELKLLEKAGKITDLQRQVKYELIPKQEGERACSYVADFVYHDVDSNKKVVEDTKGKKTKDYVIKRKLMLYVHGIKIREI